MTLRINEVVSTLNKTGVAKSSHFEIQILPPPPSSFLGKTIDFFTEPVERDIIYRAEAAEIPGRTLETTTHRFRNYGPINKIPITQIYSDVNITFLMSEDLREKEFFEVWQDAIQNTGAFVENTDLIGIEGVVPFNTRYFDDYTGTVIIRQYGEAGDLRTIHTLLEAYPIIISPMTLAWNSEENLKLQVAFAYKHYKAVYSKQNQPGLGFGFNIGINSDGDISGSIRLPGLGNIIAATGILGSGILGQITTGLLNKKNSAIIRNF